MAFAACDDERIVFHLVNNSIRIINSPAPPSLKIPCQLFRFSDSFKRTSLYILD